jgi:hypothetical protein
MDLSEVAFIPGMPGLFKIVSRRNDGVIAASLADGKTQFFPSRTHFMSPLDSITIYTTEESARLKDVLAAIHKAGDKIPFPKANDDKDLKRWMEAVLPNYDKEKVHVSDMKKLAKWSSLLAEKNLLEELTAEKEGEESAENKEGLKEKKESKPKVIKSDASHKAQSKPAPVKKITTPRKAS